uniref:Uncharacterized protein n=1 Tax=Rhizophora mucronata TaxID=61149 RepID=A0A2P2QUW0_RHIMU
MYENLESPAINTMIFLPRPLCRSVAHCPLYLHLFGLRLFHARVPSCWVLLSNSCYALLLYWLITLV